MYKEESWARRVGPKANEIYNAVRHASAQGPIIEDLFRGNQNEARTAPEKALPDGFGYTAYTPRTDPRASEAGLTVAYHAHPSDLSADFAPYIIMHLNDAGEKFSQVLATHGEAASVHFPLPAGSDIVKVREGEEQRSSDIVGTVPQYLSTNAGGNFPDGKLLEHLPELKDRIKEDIRAKKPHRILLPSPWPDHADHDAVNIAVMNAIVELKAEHFFDHHKIEIIALEPEFGVAIGQPGAVHTIPRAYGGERADSVESKIDTTLKHFGYRYHQAENGAIVTAPDIVAAQHHKELPEIADYPLAVPPVIVSVKKDMVERKIAALLQHDTQIDGKKYGNLILALDRLRGMAVGGEWGVGIYPVQIEGVTTHGPGLIDSFEPGSVYRLTRTEPQLEAGLHVTRHGSPSHKPDFLGAGI